MPIPRVREYSRSLIQLRRSESEFVDLLNRTSTLRYNTPVSSPRYLHLVTLEGQLQDLIQQVHNVIQLFQSRLDWLSRG